jgi:hypothetical protein
MSIGGPKSRSVNRAVVDAVKDGNLVVVAAGNSATDACNYSPSSARGGVISAQSSDQTDDISYFSNRGPCTDIVAPGSKIESDYIGSPRATKVLSGTSMATPAVSGTLALLLQKHGFDAAAARAELFALALPHKIYGSGVPLLQVPKNSSIVTPNPTAAPQGPVELCHAGAKNCARFKHAYYGPMEYELQDSPIEGAVYFNPTYGCNENLHDREMRGKIVVTPRGDCEFFVKSMQAQKNGALALLISNDSAGLVNPRYYGPRRTSMQTAMVYYRDIRAAKWLRWGPKSRATAAPTRSPTHSKFICS